MRHNPLAKIAGRTLALIIQIAATIKGISMLFDPTLNHIAFWYGLIQHSICIVAAIVFMYFRMAPLLVRMDMLQMGVNMRRFSYMQRKWIEYMGSTGALCLFILASSIWTANYYLDWMAITVFFHASLQYELHYIIVKRVINPHLKKSTS